MRSKLTRCVNLVRFLHVGDDKQDRQEVSEQINMESPSEADKENEEDEALTLTLGRNTPATVSSPPTIVKQMEDMILNLMFGQVVVHKQLDDQRVDSQWTQASPLMRTSLWSAMWLGGLID